MSFLLRQHQSQCRGRMHRVRTFNGANSAHKLPHLPSLAYIHLPDIPQAPEMRKTLRRPVVPGPSAEFFILTVYACALCRSVQTASSRGTLGTLPRHFCVFPANELCQGNYMNVSLCCQHVYLNAVYSDKLCKFGPFKRISSFLTVYLFASRYSRRGTAQRRVVCSKSRNSPTESVGWTAKCD